jgi:hypothetical protein
MNILRVALPIAVVLIGLSAAAAFAGTGDMGVLSAVQTPAGQAQQGTMYVGTAIGVIALVAAALVYFFGGHDLARAGATFLVSIFACVIVKNAINFVQAIPGTGAVTPARYSERV